MMETYAERLQKRKEDAMTNYDMDELRRRGEIPDEIDKIYPGHLDSFKKVINSFIDSILAGKCPLIKPEDGLKTTEIVNAAYLSEMRQEKIKFPFKGPAVTNPEIKHFKN